MSKKSSLLDSVQSFSPTDKVSWDKVWSDKDLMPTTVYEFEQWLLAQEDSPFVVCEDGHVWRKFDFNWLADDHLHVELY